MVTTAERSTRAAERPTRAEQKSRTREEIRRAALDLYEARGFDGTTIDDIAETAGIGRRTFFRYFSCKEAVLFSDDLFPRLAHDLDEALTDGLPPVRALMQAIERDGYGTEALDDVTIRRRRLRVALLDRASVSSYYRSELARIAQIVTTVVGRHPDHARVRFLPELVGGLLHTMTLEHLESGETHHFSIDPGAWRRAIRALDQSFDG